MIDDVIRFQNGSEIASGPIPEDQRLQGKSTDLLSLPVTDCRLLRRDEELTVLRCERDEARAVARMLLGDLKAAGAEFTASLSEDQFPWLLEGGG